MRSGSSFFLFPCALRRVLSVPLVVKRESHLLRGDRFGLLGVTGVGRKLEKELKLGQAIGPKDLFVEFMI